MVVDYSFGCITRTIVFIDLFRCDVVCSEDSQEINYSHGSYLLDLENFSFGLPRRSMLDTGSLNMQQLFQS